MVEIDNGRGQRVTVPLDSLPEPIRSAMQAMIARARHDIQSTVAYDPLRDSLVQPSINQKHGTVRGSSRLFQSPWSDGFIHGAEILLPFGIACDHLWKPGESLASIGKLRFIRPLNSEIDLVVSRSPLPRDSNAVVAGAFVGSQGTTLHFSGVPNGQDVTLHGPKNPIARDSRPARNLRLKISNLLGDGYAWETVDISDGMRGPREEYETAAFRLWTWTDMINTIVIPAIHKRYPSGHELALVAGYDGLRVPSMQQMVRGGMRLSAQPDWASEKRDATGMRSVVLGIELRDRGNVVGGGKVKVSFTLDSDTLRNFANRL